MKISRSIRLAVAASLLAAPALLHAQFTVPNVITTPGDVTTTLGGTTFINQGLQGVGRISASTLDSFGESFGSVSSMQITNWTGSGSSYTGTFNILPDRGYNNGNFYADYAARIQTVNFAFTPYTGSTNIGGSDYASKVAAQNQITFTSGITGTKFTYLDPTSGTLKTTTGLDPGAGTATIFGQTLPYVTSYTGNQAPSSTSTTTYSGINKLPLDSEALVLKSDGSGYIGDEYGANIYYFNAQKQIVGVITPPAAIVPHSAVGVVNDNSVNPGIDGRRNNQGFEGVSLSPDGTKLFALLQSGTVQDSNSSADQTRNQTRLVIYDVSSSATPGTPTAEYALTLPTYRSTGNGSAVNKTAAQSEIIALDDHRFLVLSRDGNGQGNASTNPSVYKSVLLVDTSLGSPTNFAGTARDAEGGKITTSPGVLDPSITPLSWTEAINMLDSAQLNKFNLTLDTGTGQVSKLTLGEKWEGMSLVSANDAAKPNDYFLFVANDNDFLTSQGKMIGPDGTLVSYDGFSGYPSSRVPAPTGDASDLTANENDTEFLVYRVTIAPNAVPEPTSLALLALAGGSLLLRRRRA